MIVTTTSNPFFGEVIRGVERACFEAGYALMICNTDDVAQRLVAYMRTLFAKRVDAVVVMTSNASPEFFRRLGQIKRVPVVAIDAPPDTVASVFSDDSILGGRLVADFLAAARLHPHRLRLRPARAPAHDRPPDAASTPRSKAAA